MVCLFSIVLTFPFGALWFSSAFCIVIIFFCCLSLCHWLLRRLLPPLHSTFALSPWSSSPPDPPFTLVLLITVLPRTLYP